MIHPRRRGRWVGEISLSVWGGPSTGIRAAIVHPTADMLWPGSWFSAPCVGLDSSDGGKPQPGSRKSDRQGPAKVYSMKRRD
jgi:hypothetical protein